MEAEQAKASIYEHYKQKYNINIPPNTLRKISVDQIHAIVAKKLYRRKQQKAAIVIQKYSRRWLAKRHVKLVKKQRSDATNKILRLWKNSLSQHKIEKVLPFIDRVTFMHIF